MKATLTNDFTMIGACISTADSPEHTPAWMGQPPEDFEPDFAQLKNGHAAALGIATLAGSVITGAAHAEDEAGRRFIAAWKQARIIVDAGHGPGEDTPPTPPTP